MRQKDIKNVPSAQTDHKTPGQLIQDLLDERDWTQRILALVLGMDESTVNKVLKAQRPVGAEMAIGLSEIFDIPAEQFLDLQKSWDLTQARLLSRPNPDRINRAHLFGKLPVSEMARRGWLDVKDIRDVAKVQSELVRFFGVGSVDEIEILPHAAKKTEVSEEATPTQIAWLYRVKEIASELLTARYSPEAVELAVERLRPLRATPSDTRKVPRILQDAGIRFVIVESLPGAKIDGVCFWLDDSSPVIAMTLRFDRIDNFWFVLRHELEHVLRLDGRTTIMLDTELDGENAGVGENIPTVERIANAEASNFCVPDADLMQFVTRKAPFYHERDIIGFARTIKVHPGLVAGQLQHRINRYDRFRQHLVKIRAFVLPSAPKDGWGDVYPVGI